FWHRFVLTRHSPMYAEWRAGKRPDLRVVEPAWSFGANDLSFEGEKSFDRWGDGLDAALGAWMERADIDRPVRDWFDFKVSRPRVAEDHVRSLASAAARRARAPGPGRGRRAVWLGGRLLREDAADGRVRVTWAYRNVLRHVDLEPARAAALQAALADGRIEIGRMDALIDALNAAGNEPVEATKAFRTLRRFGLVAV
ncbi:MAG TPA: hypothetical protein VHE79_04565, partial [Spirochaetia bacterium]